MDASIKGSDKIRTFVRLLQCASKFGDDLHIAVGHSIFEMSSIDSSKSAYCLFQLKKEFFKTFTRRAKQEVNCRILAKSILVVLGKSSQLSSVQRIDLRIIDPSNELKPRPLKREPGEDNEASEYSDNDELQGGIEAKLIMRLVCDHEVVRKHSLHLSTSEFNRAHVDPDTTPSGFCISSRILRDWLDHFSLVLPNSSSSPAGGLGQLGWLFAKDHVRIKTWEGGVDKDVASGMNTQIQVDADEFDEYELLADRVDLMLPMKEFKAMLTLAEQLSIMLNISFSESGQPLTLINLEDDLENMTIFCAIATRECRAFEDVRLAKELAPSGFASRAASRAESRAVTPSEGVPNGTSGSARGSNRKKESQKRPSRLSFYTKTQDEDKLVTVYLPEHSSQRPSLSPHRPSQHQAGPSGIRTKSHDADDDHPYRPSSMSPPQLPNNAEPLFLPNSQDQEPPHSPHSYHHSQRPPTQTQGGAIRMTQQQLLEYAGLGDVDMDVLGEELDLEEEEEYRASQAVREETRALGIDDSERIDDPVEEEEKESFTWDTTIDFGQMSVGGERQLAVGAHVPIADATSREIGSPARADPPQSHGQQQRNHSPFFEPSRPRTRSPSQSQSRPRLGRHDSHGHSQGRRRSTAEQEDSEDSEIIDDGEDLRSTQLPSESSYRRLFD